MQIESHGNQQLLEINRQLESCSLQIEDILLTPKSVGKNTDLLNATAHQLELTCIELRKLCETTRPKKSAPKNGKHFYNKAIYGEVTLMDTGWLHIKLNTLLPHYKILGGTQYITDCITRLLDKFSESGGTIPMFSKAFLAIVEHCPVDCSEAFDHDNKGFKSVQNALKGRLFPDDNQFELSLGLFTVLDADMCCHIYVLPDEEAGDFFYYKAHPALCGFQ